MTDQQPLRAFVLYTIHRLITISLIYHSSKQEPQGIVNTDNYDDVVSLIF